MIVRAWKTVLSLWDDDTSENPVVYDPAQVAAVIVGCMAAVGVLFWVLWGLMVFEGGLFIKVIPFFQVLFTSKTRRDFGYEGSPYALGVFEGWIVNLGAVAIALILLGAVRWAFRRTGNPSTQKNPPTI